MAAQRLRIPVISSMRGMGDCVRQQLRASTCPVGALLRADKLEIVDVPSPSPATREWPLTPQHEQLLQDATVVLGDSNLLAPLLLTPETALPDGKQQLLARVRWVQSTFAGAELYQKLHASAASSTPPSFALTRAGGVMSLAMAQYVLGWIIALERKFFDAQNFQRDNKWAKTELVYRPFSRLTVGVLGFGDFGQAIGRLCKTSGFQVLGFKRSVHVEDAASASAHRLTTNLAQVLEEADVIVSVLPSTASTRYLLTEEQLSLCSRKKPLFINVGRGDVVSEQTLLHALDKCWLSHAVLDVFETEPLPPTSALWSHPNVSITPHLSAISFPEDVATVFIDNLNRFLANEPLQFAFDWSRGY
ncbi:TPA: hypothetical protein N0F65_002216 [Lagenidium giganteum]|uniref:D-isomer specific 2-hydroxyacid dehydrogenase NAD-binding domain-containing protein n=1 Tax=Lagenidium giganteum TaxID=4803 RepID=A0AAV2YRG7_9STRA|nr:TPA: hypothetical protein N0F65_002216 [Lagenidium giganteum]